MTPEQAWRERATTSIRRRLTGKWLPVQPGAIVIATASAEWSSPRAEVLELVGVDALAKAEAGLAHPRAVAVVMVLDSRKYGGLVYVEHLAVGRTRQAGMCPGDGSACTACVRPAFRVSRIRAARTEAA